MEGSAMKVNKTDTGPRRCSLSAPLADVILWSFGGRQRRAGNWGLADGGRMKGDKLQEKSTCGDMAGNQTSAPQNGKLVAKAFVGIWDELASVPDSSMFLCVISGGSIKAIFLCLNITFCEFSLQVVIQASSTDSRERELEMYILTCMVQRKEPSRLQLNQHEGVSRVYLTRRVWQNMNCGKESWNKGDGLKS